MPAVAAVRYPDSEVVVPVAGRIMDNGMDDAAEESVPVHELPVERLAGIVSELGGAVLDNLVLGFPPAPFVLVLLVDNPAAFAEYIDNFEETDVRVHLEYARDGGTNRPISRDWEIVPVDDLGFRLSFTLPARELGTISQEVSDPPAPFERREYSNDACPPPIRRVHAVAPRHRSH